MSENKCKFCGADLIHSAGGFKQWDCYTEWHGHKGGFWRGEGCYQKCIESIAAERDRMKGEVDEWKRLVDRLRQENRLLTHRHDDMQKERDRWREWATKEAQKLNQTNQ